MALENLRQPDGFISLTDIFMERVRLNKLLDRIEQVDMRDEYDATKYSNLTYDGCVDALEELDNTISTIREVERGVEEYEVIVEETIAYTVNVKATSRTEAEHFVQSQIDHHQFFDTFACDGESQDLHIYSVEEVA